MSKAGLAEKTQAQLPVLHLKWRGSNYSTPRKYYHGGKRARHSPVFPGKSETNKHFKYLNLKCCYPKLFLKKNSANQTQCKPPVYNVSYNLSRKNHEDFSFVVFWWELPERK
jgi:hypothetical protein